MEILMKLLHCPVVTSCVNNEEFCAARSHCCCNIEADANKIILHAVLAKFKKRKKNSVPLKLPCVQ